MTCLGVVTARGGSKGLLGKNLAAVGGRPLVVRAIESAGACADVTRCVVTTDSKEIREVALAAGAEVPFLRPAELATDEARQEDAILHAMDWFEERGERFDLVCLLEPTSPFRRADTLARGFELLRDRAEADAVLSVVEAGAAPFRSKAVDADGFMRAWADDPYRWANRQELPTLHRPAGVVAISRWDAFRRERTFLHERTLALVVDPLEAVDVDGPLDLAVAEALAGHAERPTVRRPPARA